MRILHIVHQYLPEQVGGTELYTQLLARRQVQSGHESVIFYPSVVSQTLEPEQVEGVRVYRVPVGPRTATQRFQQTIVGQRAISQALHTVLQRERPDLVHLQHLMGLPATLPQQLVAQNIPYVVTLHDYWYGCANAQLYTNDTQANCKGPRGFRNCGRCFFARAGMPAWLAPTAVPLLAYRQAQLRHVLAHARFVITPTRFVQSMYAGMGFPQDNFVHIPHGIDVPQQRIAQAKRAHPPVSQGPLKICYIGGIAPQKGLHILIEAFNTLPDAAELTIYGNLEAFPDYVAALRQLIRHPRLALAGRLAHEHIWGAIAQAMAVVVPTLWYEASPLIIDEVFAVGTPLIASDLGAMREKIAHGVDGLLVAVGDVAAWRGVLQGVYDQPQRLAELRAGIRPIFTIEAHLGEILTLYERCL